MFKTWIKVLIKPKDTFRKEKSNADAVELIKMICIAGIFAAIIHTVIFTIFNIPSVGFFESSYGLSGKIMYAIIMMFWIPIYSIINLAILSAFLSLSAKIFKGSGDLTTQTYMIALFVAPTIIISTLFIIPHIGPIIAVTIILYSMYLLTLALKETHGYSTTNAILTWLVLLIPVVLAALFFMLSLFHHPPHQVDVHNFVLNESINS